MQHLAFAYTIRPCLCELMQSKKIRVYSVNPADQRRAEEQKLK